MPIVFMSISVQVLGNRDFTVFLVVTVISPDMQWPFKVCIIILSISRRTSEGEIDFLRWVKYLPEGGGMYHLPEGDV